MSLDFLSVYDYMSFILPGGVVILAGWYSLTEAKYAEPGAFAAILIGIAAYVIGQAVAAVWNWFEPVAWGHWPFSRVDRTWGLIGDHGTYTTAEGATITAVFQKRYGSGAFATDYDLGYAEIQQSGHGDFLAIMNQQIGLFGHLCMACGIGLVMVATTKLPYQPTGLSIAFAVVLALGVLLFGLRYRYFWKRFGDQVVRQVRLMAVPAAGQPATAMPAKPPS